ncbi:MAG: protein of unknown function [Nitrospira sp.]
MTVMHEERLDATICEKRLMDILCEKGPQTLDRLCSLPDLSWSQVLLAVDHLSRTCEVNLELMATREYLVSLAERPQ